MPLSVSRRLFAAGLRLSVLLSFIGAPFGSRIAAQNISAQQQNPASSSATVSTNPAAAQAERDWDSAVANALTAAHNLSDAQQNGSNSATINDLQSKYEKAVKAANDAWDNFQSCLPESQRCRLGNSDEPATAPANAVTSPQQAPAPAPPQRSARGSDSEWAGCSCESLRWEAEWADHQALAAEDTDREYAKIFGHRNPDYAANTATREDAARAAWAKYKACLAKRPCPAPAHAAEPTHELEGLFSLIFGTDYYVFEQPPPLSVPPPSPTADTALPPQFSQEANAPEAPGHFVFDEFGHLSFQCDDKGCSVAEPPAGDTLTLPAGPAGQQGGQTSNSKLPDTSKLVARIRYELMGNWKTRGCIKYAVSPIASRSFGTIPLVYERKTQSTETNYTYSVILPNGKSFTFTLAGTVSPGPRALAEEVLRTIEWPRSRPIIGTRATSSPANRFSPAFEFRGFGGASFINWNTPPTAGFDGAVLFPLGNRVLLGPTGGFRWSRRSMVNSFGSMLPGSTFIYTSAGFKQGNFGGSFEFVFGTLAGQAGNIQKAFWTDNFILGIHAGATVAGSAITRQSGFCGTGGPTAPAGCTVLSSTTTHDTVVGPFVGGYISHSIFSHVGVFVEYDYTRLKDTAASGTPGSSTSSSGTIFDVHSNSVIGGLTLSFGRHH